MTSKIPFLVSTAWLESNLQTPGMRIVDCRWVLGKPGEGRMQYGAGHIPGAVHLDVDQDLSGNPATGPGRHPIPTKQDFQKIIAGIGVGRETHVIVYDEGKGAPAARLWWLLGYYGHEAVSILDGGFSLWTQDGRPVSQEVSTFQAGKFTARPKRRWVVDKAVVDSLRDDPQVLLIDARAPERYRGEVEPIDSRPGHIPGAVNFPFSQTLDPSTGRFLEAAELKERLAALGVAQAGTVICYCGSGVTACTDILALRMAGFNAKLYEGSWSEWSRDPDMSIAR